MSSERLYYTDAYLIEFDAIVRDVRDEGERWKVSLDRTAFYPTSGGQPFDVGTLDDARVLDVEDDEEGTIWHLVDRRLEQNARLRGRVDWERRFDHMQQHTGQHVLSAAFEREAGARTVSFHLGTAASTIDLDRELSAEAMAEVERAANRVVWEDREIGVRFVSESEAAELPLRKDPARSGELRIVEIPDYDLSACGGTHVGRTGAIGVIVLSAFERFKGGVRVEFLCGRRALDAYHRLKRAVDGSVRLVSVLPDELPGAIERLQQSNRQHEKTRDELVARLALHQAASLAASRVPVGAVELVSATVDGWDAQGLKKLAAAITSESGRVAALATSESPMLVVIARAADVSADVAALFRRVVETHGGRGGGKGVMAQGGGMSGSPAEVLATVRAALADMP